MSIPATKDYLEVLKKKVTENRDRANTYLDSADPDIERVNQLVDKLSESYDSYSQTYDLMVRNHYSKVLILEDYDNFTQVEILFNVMINDQLTSLYDKRKTLKNKITASSIKTASSIPKVRYPEIKLVTFSGDKTRWDAWWQSYNSMVHTRTELDQVSKFNYLLTTLEGEARKCVDRFEITEKGYLLAVTALTNKYSDPAASKRILIRRLLDIKSPSVSRIELENFKEDYLSYAHKLRLLSIDLSNSEWLIQEHLIRKLPQVVTDFIFDKADTLYPSIDEILDNVTLYIQRHMLNKSQALKVEQPERPPRYQVTGTQKGAKGSFPSWKKTSPKATKSLAVMESSANNHHYNCIYCEGEHGPTNCRQYPDRKRRIDRLKALNRCPKCCKAHAESPCTAKLSPRFKCKGDHHTWLCDQIKKPVVNAEGSTSKKSGSWQVSCEGQNAALPTATVTVVNTDGKNIKQSKVTRCFFDQGSQRSFISESLSRELQLKVSSTVKLQLSGFTGEKEEMEYQIVKPSVRLGKRIKKISAVVIRNLPSRIQTPGLKRTAQHLAKAHKLADQNLTSDTLEHIGLIIGAEYYGRFVTGIGKREGVDVLETPGGVVIYGPIPLTYGSNVKVNHVSVYNMAVRSDVLSKEQCQDNTPRMWDLTNMGISPTEQAVDDSEAYSSYLDTVQYVDKKYWVRLPWKKDCPVLPNNYYNCKAQIRSQLNKLRKQPEQLAHYEKILGEQIALGFIEKCDTHSAGVSENQHYLPHFGVAKDSLTTPLRLVYNAASKASPGEASLNDCLMTGPNLTEKLLNTLVRFRVGSYAYSADISKAFLCLGLQECDRDFTRFLWSENPKDPEAKIVPYRFRSVLFGATSSPFLLQVTLDLHFRTSTGQYKDIIRRNFYVDNLLGSTNCEQQLVDIYYEANQELSQADMPLRAWATNSPILTKILQFELGTYTPFEDLQNVLGLDWRVSSDQISVKSLEPYTNAPTTKREVLSRVSSLFDPLGLVSPLTMKGKLLVQAAWQLSLGWDDRLPEAFTEDWPEIEYSLTRAGTIVFPRSVVLETEEVQLHVFCDASSKAYGACAYTVTSSDANLLISKAKVAPLKSRTLPQLELMALLVGARLAQYIDDTLSNIKFGQIHLWSDNEACIQWVRNNRSEIVFVKNRVAEIRELTTNIKIHHVNTKANPADFLTRGVLPEVMLESPLWFKGPNWLPYESEWPQQKAELVSVQNIGAAEQANHSGSLRVLAIETYSDFKHLINVTRQVFKFLKIKIPSLKLPTPTIYWIRQAQREYYPEVYEILNHRTQTLTNNTNLKLIKDLGLFEEEGSGLLRSRGRLTNAELPASTKFPMLLPNRSQIAKLIVLATHEWTLHSGVQDTLTAIRQWCWIPKGRQLVKTIVNRCTICRRFEAQQLSRPGPPVLPVERLVNVRPFQSTGVDYTGAIHIKDSATGEEGKVYICLFTCMVSRNIHLEVAIDLSAMTFLNVFRRFAATCSLPQTIVSDHGTNLSATAKFLAEMYQDQNVQNYLLEHHISWKFIHVRSPWEGGFYERLIGVVKSCLKKILYRKTLDLQELITVVTEVKARVNNRPLTYVSSELQAMESLTPSHLMCGRRINTMPPLELEDDLDPSYELDQRELSLKYTHLSKIILRFESIFQKEYLTALREKNYGNNPPNTIVPIKVGDIVLIESTSHRERWPLGRITQLLPDPDGTVRAVKVFSRGIESIKTLGKLVKMEVSEPALPQTAEEEVLSPEEPELTLQEAQRPKRAAAEQATQRIRQLFKEERA